MSLVKPIHYPPSYYNETNAMLTEDPQGGYVFMIYAEAHDYRSAEQFDDIQDAAKAWYSRKLDLEIAR